MSTDTAAPITWAPTETQIRSSRMQHFIDWLREVRGVTFGDYRALWRWSVDDVSGFWDAIREYFDVLGDGFTGPALATDRMPFASWYPQARVNFAENVLRHAADAARADAAAITEVAEDGATSSLTWTELERRVAALAASLRSLGVGPGDRIAAVLPNVPEAIIGLLASASIGAVWSIASPDLAPDVVLRRFGQLNPKVLFGVTAYRYNGKRIDRSDYLDEVARAIDGLEHTIVIDGERDGARPAPGSSALAFDDLIAKSAAPSYARVPFEHPLWVLFSSGTTGAPKGIVHGHGGMLLEALKAFGLHFDAGPADRYFVAANTSWMVWNTLVHTLATGAEVLCYSGTPTFERKDRLFQILAENRVTYFATGAAYLTLVENAGIVPREEFDFSHLRMIASTASPLPDSTWQWVHDAVRKEVHLGSDTGGTDVCSIFIGSNPLEPVHLGYLQGPLLGVAAEAWNDAGERVVGDVGELVIRRPMPSMPTGFWGDDDGDRYRSSYFERFPGVWMHGDWVTENERGEFVVHGRSDATLNRDGVRLGTADIYEALQHVDEVIDSVAVGVELPGGAYYQPLFVRLAAGLDLDDTVRDRIVEAIRRHASPRHVPDEIHAVPEIPVTPTGKKIEVQIKRILAGRDAAIDVARQSLANPRALDWFVDFAGQIAAAASTSSAR